MGPQQFTGTPTTTTVVAPQIHTADLKPFVVEAVARWTAAGITPAQAAILKSVQFEVRDLGKLLGLGGGNSIIIDDNAAGQGWYIDPAPGNDVEFTTRVTNVERLATRGSTAAKGVDLLSVVIHELGHAIGLDDLNPQQQPHQVMTDELGLGTRRTPQPIAVDALMWALRASIRRRTLNPHCTQTLAMPPSRSGVANVVARRVDVVTSRALN